MRLLFIAFVPLLCVAEIIASWLIWDIAPRHSLEIHYAGFWNFELGRMIGWVVVVAGAIVIWAATRLWVRHDHDAAKAQLRQWRKSRYVSWAVVAVLSELLTSGIYWQSGRSSGLRELYQSPYYLGRVAQATDFGWPSFRGYMWIHLAFWTVVVLVGIGCFYMWHKLKQQCSKWPISDDGNPTPREGVR